MKRRTTLTLTGMTLFGLVVGVLSQAGAESLVEQTVDSRMVLAFKVDPVELQKIVPGPWEIVGTAGGPAKDANFFVIFDDRMLHQDGAGTTPAPPFRFVALVEVIKPKGESGPAVSVSRVYVDDQRAVPGPYKNSVLSTVKRSSSVELGSNQPYADERWEILTPQNQKMSLSLKYEKSTPTRQKAESRTYSSVNTDFYRIYRWDTISEVAKSAPAGIDRLKSYQFNVDIPEYASVFSRAQLIAIISQPMYIRNVWLP